MTDHKAKPVSELSLSEKIIEAEKMAADGVPFEIICKTLKIKPNPIFEKFWVNRVNKPPALKFVNF